MDGGELMKVKEWCQSKEKTLIRLLLVSLLVLVGGFLFFEQCTPVFSVVERVWAFLSRLVSAIWGGFGWPHAAILIFSLLLINYKSEIGAFIQRVEEVGPSGVRTGRLVPPVSASEAETVQGPDNTEVGITTNEVVNREVAPTVPYIPRVSLPPIYFPGQMSQVREWIVEELDRVPEEEKIDYLLDHLAYCRVWGDFESTYSSALGGQLNLLSEISLHFANGMPLLVVEDLWRSHQAKLKPALDDWTVDQYTWLLKSRFLLADNDGALSITLKGREFLAWMSASGKTLNKPW